MEVGAGRSRHWQCGHTECHLQAGITRELSALCRLAELGFRVGTRWLGDHLQDLG